MMKIKTLKVHYLLKLFIFWLLFFSIFRLLFVIYHHTRIPDSEHSETVLAFFYAIPLDISAACAGLMVPYILWAFQQFHKRRFIHLLNLSLIIFLIIALTTLSIANIKMYGEWGTLLNSRALYYLLYPREITHFISGWSLFLLLTGCVFISYIFIRTYRKNITNFSYPIENKYLKYGIIVLTPFLLILGYRGGFQLAPINESQSYYSSVPINNHIATNNIWYLVHSIVDANNTGNPYEFMGKEEAEKTTAKLYTPTSMQKITPFLKTQRPNIVIIILESWTADIIKSLGGEPDVTPHFDELRKEGLLFTQVYASGFRTDQGLVSILSGFPGQPNNSIINTPSKSEKLPSMITEMVNQGYNSSFYYGGEIEFANMKSYLTTTKFQKIIDKKDFSSDQLNSKWGAHDEFVLKKQLHDLSQEKTPFVSVVLTLSTHEPFEVTMNTPFNGTAEKEKFKKAAYYTDNCLFNYFNEAKKQPWYKNTLFLLIADHGHNLPKDRDMSYAEGRRITNLLVGGALTDSLKGKTIGKIGNQSDWAVTLLSQLHLPTDKFNWSKNLMDPSTKAFAYYSNENCLGWITPQKNYVYDYISKSIIEQKKNSDSTATTTSIEDAKAYLQTLYQTYLDY